MIITGLYASILALLIIFLAFKVVVFRRSESVSLGDAGSKNGLKAIRAHANALEYIPIIIILMGLYESNSGSHMILHIVGVISVIARSLHAFGLSKTGGVSFGRFYGTLFTWIITIVLAGLNIYQFIQLSFT